MAVYRTKQALNSFPGIAPHGQGEQRSILGVFDLAVEGGGTAIAISDVIHMCKLPAGCIPVGCHTYNDEIDTGTAIVWDVGITEDTEGATEDVDTFIAASVAGQTATTGDDEDPGAAWNILAPVNNDRVVGITVSTGPTTSNVTGVIHCLLTYISVESRQ